jgi:2-keto-3-deoxy-galactonokinase
VDPPGGWPHRLLPDGDDRRIVQPAPRAQHSGRSPQGAGGRERRVEQGVRTGLEGDALTAELFSVRARVLLGKARRQDAASYTSGLLIGSDIRTGLQGGEAGDEVVVMGRPELTSLFAAALRIAGRTAREVDGEEAFLAGVKHLGELVQ